MTWHWFLSSWLLLHAHASPDVCVATIMTSDRVGSLHRLARSWPGPLSVAFLAADFHVDVARGLMVLELDGTLPPRPERIALSIVRDEGLNTRVGLHAAEAPRSAASRATNSVCAASL
eukprot:2837431-Prymnesium_polylepis.2